MLLYNTTFGIDPSIEKTFIGWLKFNFIPTAQDYFTSPEIFKVVGGDPATVSIAVHFRAELKSDIENWYSDRGAALFSEVIETWQGGAVYFSTVLEEI